MCSVTVDLYQPDPFAYAPQSRDHEEQNLVVWSWSPEEQADEDSQVQQEGAAYHWYTARQFDHRATSDGSYGVEYSVADHHIADVGNTPSTCHVRLEQPTEEL